MLLRLVVGCGQITKWRIIWGRRLGNGVEYFSGANKYRCVQRTPASLDPRSKGALTLLAIHLAGA